MDVAKLHNPAGVNEEEVVLPGFRFHPTDEELVGFYLLRKVEKKPLRIELIKQVDIYKYDPWDLPRVNCMGDKEWYFFCIRGRKYKNSARPNRVTRSGFWKATGIDKSIYCMKEPRECIGLKKSLVYYRGSAGKGTKTDWMMHEFRLPPGRKAKTDDNNIATPHANAANDFHEAEVWTLCRIFKRVPSYKKYTPKLKDYSEEATSFTNLGSDHHQNLDINVQQFDKKPVFGQQVIDQEKKHFFVGQQFGYNNLANHELSTSTVSYNPSWNPSTTTVEDTITNENWEDDLRSVFQFVANDQTSLVNDCTDTYIPSPHPF